MNKRIEKWLEKFLFVQWDRFCVDEEHTTIFGWIERDDEYKDFIVLYFIGGFLDSYMTSSSFYSLPIYKMINGGSAKGHVNCQRVEGRFNVNNSIKLRRVGFQD